MPPTTANSLCARGCSRRGSAGGGHGRASRMTRWSTAGRSTIPAVTGAQRPGTANFMITSLNGRSPGRAAPPRRCPWRCAPGGEQIEDDSPHEAEPKSSCTGSASPRQAQREQPLTTPQRFGRPVAAGWRVAPAAAVTWSIGAWRVIPGSGAGTPARAADPAQEGTPRCEILSR